MVFEQKRILAGGIKVSYYDEGDQEGDVVIFIHGFPFDKSTWESQIEFFRKSYRVVAYDVRGHGKSGSGTKEFTMDQFARDLLRLMKALSIDKAVLCGLSMGGYIALNTLLEQPERITGLILSNTQCMADTEEGRKKRFETIDDIRVNGLETFAHKTVQNLFSDGSLSENRDAVLKIESLIRSNNPESVCNTLKAMAKRSETCSTLYLMEIPVLIIAGEEDKIIPMENIHKMHESIPGSSLEIMKGVGHMSNIEEPEQFNTSVHKFLENISG